MKQSIVIEATTTKEKLEKINKNKQLSLNRLIALNI